MTTIVAPMTRSPIPIGLRDGLQRAARVGDGPNVGVRPLAVAVLLVASLAGCAEGTRIPDRADVGSQPLLVAPVSQLVPTVDIAPAKPWPSGQTPVAAPGLQVMALASGLQHPRWLHVLPNGDVLVAESNAPPKDGGPRGLKGWAMALVMKRAGAGVPSANRITLLRDADGDGIAELRSVFLEGLNSPFGMALVGDRLYVANTDAVVEFAYTAGQTRIDSPGRTVTELPAGAINHHWTRSLIASPDGQRLYATVGSNSNAGENGLEAEQGRAAVWEIDRQSGRKRPFATGLRNPNGMAWQATPGSTVPTLWVVVNERDELGSDLVPDYLTSVRDGGFYGWPWSWYGPHVDVRVQPPRPDRVATALVPDYALGAHVAALGLTDSAGSPIPQVLSGLDGTGPAAVAHGLFIGLHGSWNRRPLSGYKVVYLPFHEGRPKGLPIDVLTGFVGPEGQARGRPVGVALDPRGALLVADDVGNTVWRVTPR